jgi:hypothetical protein
LAHAGLVVGTIKTFENERLSEAGYTEFALGDNERTRTPIRSEGSIFEYVVLSVSLPSTVQAGRRNTGVKSLGWGFEPRAPGQTGCDSEIESSSSKYFST